jgi:hypothetical protein
VSVEAAIVFIGVDPFAVAVKAFAENPPFTLCQTAVSPKVVPQFPNLSLLAAQVPGFSAGNFAAGDPTVNPKLLIFKTLLQGTGRSRCGPDQTNDNDRGCGENVSFLHGILLCCGFTRYDAQEV